MDDWKNHLVYNPVVTPWTALNDLITGRKLIKTYIYIIVRLIISHLDADHRVPNIYTKYDVIVSKADD